MSRFQAPWTANGPLIRVGLIDFLEGGETIAELLALDPSIYREQIMAAIDFANHRLIECACSLTNGPPCPGLLRSTPASRCA